MSEGMRDKEDEAGDDAQIHSVAEYSETARTYRSVSITVAVMIAAFGLDMLVTGVHGAVTHLPGWVVFGGILVGVHVLLIYAVRATHSLTLTADELRIGDESVARADIIGLGRELDPDAPVLGWPTARPRGARMVALRVAGRGGGTDVAVPTRFPDELAAALGVGAPDAREPVTIRTAREDDYPLLAEVDDRAEAVFRVSGYDLPRIEFDTAALNDARAVFVAGDPPLAFAVVDEVDGLAHLSEVSVVPGAMRQGIGTALVERACDWARDAGYPAITLTTYAEVPWNAPFYASRGFREHDGATPGLAAARQRERDLGLDAVGRRVVMRREL